jgi:putative DNA primase/helicase
MAIIFTPKTPIMDLAQGRWVQILTQLGVAPEYLRDRHGPCPFCGGKDRYRFDDKGGMGTFFCNHCGPGNGIEFVKRWRKVEFGTAADDVRAALGESHVAEPAIPAKVGKNAKLAGEPNGDAAQRLWDMGCQITRHDEAGQYLLSRGIEIPKTTDHLRFMQNCLHAPGTTFAALIAAIRSPDGRLVSVHKTFLLSGKKAPVTPVRKVMKGALEEGSAVPLTPFGRAICVGEGIETSLAAGMMFKMPVFATLSAQGMANFIPPQDVEIVTICADNDRDGCGQRAATTLAERLLVAGYEVDIETPDHPGSDWNDVLLEEG